MQFLFFCRTKSAAAKGNWTHKRQVQCLILVLSLTHTGFGMLRYLIPEEMKRRSFVGNVALDLRLDVKQLTARNACVVSEGGRQYCQLDLNTGILFVNERIDREELCQQTSACILEFQVVLDTPYTFNNILVEIQDINDNPPRFHENEVTLEISETSMPGASFPLDSAHDPDIGSNSLQSYRLSKNEHFKLETRSRTHGSMYAELVLEKALDREKQAELSLVLSAIDGGTPERSGTIKIHVIVMDANDNAPVFNQAVYKAILAENAPKDTLVIRVNATDPDEGSFGEVTYSFRHASDKPSQLFAINPKTGEIRVQGEVDFETAKGYDIDIQAKDSGSLTSHCKVLIEIADLNDNAPVI